MWKTPYGLPVRTRLSTPAPAITPPRAGRPRPAPATAGIIAAHHPAPRPRSCRHHRGFPSSRPLVLARGRSTSACPNHHHGFPSFQNPSSPNHHHGFPSFQKPSSNHCHGARIACTMTLSVLSPSLPSLPSVLAFAPPSPPPSPPPRVVRPPPRIGA